MRRSIWFGLLLVVALILGFWAFARSTNNFYRIYGAEVGDGIYKGRLIGAWRIEDHGSFPEAIAKGGPGIVPTRAWHNELLKMLPRMAGEAKSCAPNPGVALRFEHNKSDYDLLICFECGMLGLRKPSDPPWWANWSDFDSIEKELAQLVKQIFPNDPEVQKL